MTNKLVIIDHICDKKGNVHYMVPGIIVKDHIEYHNSATVLVTYITHKEIYINAKKIVSYL